MNLIPEWRQWWRMHSQWAFLILVGLNAAWATGYHFGLAGDQVIAINAAIAAVGAVLRLRQQTPTP